MGVLNKSAVLQAAESWYNTRIGYRNRHATLMPIETAETILEGAVASLRTCRHSGEVELDSETLTHCRKQLAKAMNLPEDAITNACPSWSALIVVVEGHFKSKHQDGKISLPLDTFNWLNAKAFPEAAEFCSPEHPTTYKVDSPPTATRVAVEEEVPELPRQLWSEYDMKFWENRRLPEQYALVWCIRSIAILYKMIKKKQ
jgi:hypothetical protein